MAEQLTTYNPNETTEPYRPTMQQVYEFLQSQKMGHIATLDEKGHPQVAIVAFSQTPDLDFIIGTSQTSRKALNIGHDERCAFEVTDTLQRYTVQVEATGRVLSADEFEAAQQAHFEKLPESLPFKDLPDQCYIRLSPIHLRFTDCATHPWAATDFEF